MKFQVTALFTTLSMISGSVYGLNTNTAGDFQLQTVKNIGLSESIKFRDAIDAIQEAHELTRETIEAPQASGVQLPAIRQLEQQVQSKYDFMEKHLVNFVQELGESTDFLEDDTCNLGCRLCKGQCIATTFTTLHVCTLGCNVACPFMSKDKCDNCHDKCNDILLACYRCCEKVWKNTISHVINTANFSVFNSQS